MKVLVIGANGLTGQRVVKLLARSPHDPVAMIRHPGQRAGFDELGVATVLADLEYPIDHAVRGCDGIIFAAGSGSKTGKDKTVLIDHLGSIRAAVAALVNGAKRFVMLSALNATVNSESAIKHYHRARAHADGFLRTMPEVFDGQGLDWTIVCPGRLTNDRGTGRVAISDEIHGGGKTSRDNLAKTLVACLDQPNTVGRAFGLLDGNTALSDALNEL
ncbi:MAG: SDR family oxidoreductase [Proteobacteria bacterium]|nr:SDR family oxidoreductase [Pseudomonadota bacterium]